MSNEQGKKVVGAVHGKFGRWAYVTIDKKGNLINGKPTRFKQHCWQQND